MIRSLRCTLVAALLGLALDATAEERIRDFEAELVVARDGMFRVTERIGYDFGTNRRRGIFREIPVRYGRGSAADYRIALDVEAVTDATGGERPYELSNEGRNRYIRIGDPNVRVDGHHDYHVRYRVRRGILWLEEHDEIYWNVTGNGWRVPMETVRFRISVPDGSAGGLRVLCFTGRMGAIETDCRSEVSGDEARFATTRRLGPGEGLTVVLALPKGVLDEPGALAKLLDRASDYVNAATALPFVTFFGLGAYWRRFGRDPVARNNASYENSRSPAAVRAMT